MSLGGAKVVLCTAPSGRAISEIVGGLGRGGQAVVVSAAADPITIPPGLLLGGGRSIKGSVEGDVEEALRFSLMSGVKPMVETFPLEQSLRPDRNSHRVHINRPFPCAPV
jgi:D-arabinose 1-dehydrogenase-like Zn-dependent alcohol dehydrogenase